MRGHWIISGSNIKNPVLALFELHAGLEAAPSFSNLLNGGILFVGQGDLS